MKKLVLLLVSVFTLQFASADNDKPITVEQLPAVAQQFVKKHFASEKVAFAKEDSELFDTSYEVMFANGDKVEFNKKGEWTDIKCKHSQVPAAVVPPFARQPPIRRVSGAGRGARVFGWWGVRPPSGFDIPFPRAP